MRSHESAIERSTRLYETAFRLAADVIAMSNQATGTDKELHLRLNAFADGKVSDLPEEEVPVVLIHAIAYLGNYLQSRNGVGIDGQ